jgi:two-component system CheB/CheR fusion protein
MRDMETELQHTRESLQAAIEELETTNEELQATNEELLAANEELQSTNEELQSVNEELFTVNAEYQAKIAELTELNHDIDAYLSGTQVGAIYLDRTLTIRKFTPAVAAQINVMDRDIGRPLGHISHNLDGVDLVTESLAVLQTEKTVEREVSGTNGNRYIARLMAYRGIGGELRGVVITFVDVTAIRGEAETLRQGYRGLEDNQAGILILNHRGEVQWVNGRFAALTGYDRRQLVGCNPRILLDRSAPEGLFDDIRASLAAQSSWSGQVGTQRRNGDQLRLRALATPLRDARGGDSGTLIIAVQEP